VPTGRRIGSVDVHGFRVTVGMIRWPSMLGEGGVLLARASMPCRFTCGAWGKGACTFRNGNAALGVQSVHERGQCAG
jgi:hypothetical protein